MEPTLVLLILAVPATLIGIIARVLIRVSQKTTGEGWTEAAESLGLHLEDRSLRGEIDGIEVDVTLVDKRRGQNTVVHTEFGARVIPGWSLVERAANTLERTGDDVFDAQLCPGGDPSVWRSLLDADARRALVRLARGSYLEIEEGRMWFVIEESVRSAAAVSSGLDAVLAAARPLFLRGALGKRESLAELARHDPEPGVRRRAARQLLEIDDETSRRSAPYLLQDPDPAVRSEAALLLGDAEALAASVADPKLAEPFRVQALQALDPTAEATRPALATALMERGELAAAALAVVRDHQLAAHGDAAVRLCTQATNPTRAVAAEAVTALQRHDAAAGLIATLEADEPARTAALRAVASLGGPEAIEPVEALAHPRIVAALRQEAEATLQALRARG